jgi:hypothetical protein
MNGSFGEDQAKERGETGVRICTETREDISQKERKKEKKKKRKKRTFLMRVLRLGPGGG